MNRESDDPLDDIGTWAQPVTGKSESSALPVSEPTDAFRSYTPSKPAFPSEDGSVTPSETPEPSGDTTSRDSRNPSTSKAQDRTRAVPGSSEWDITAPPLIAQGEILFGKYRLDEQIGEGGMGSVWKVWHVDMESERALKLIKPEIAQNDKGWKRFRREAQLMDKIKHPGAVRVYDYKRTQGLGYIEMEFVRGRSLDQILKSRDGDPMPLDWTARVIEQLCAVLQEAHGHVDEKTGVPKPIIHRDLKPSNLMLIEVKHHEEAIRLKVLDFGIAKMIEDDGGGDQTVTGAGDLLGTPAYMSPEQIKSAFEKEEDKPPIDGRSDLYSTGVVLYHLLTGVRPFRGNSMGLIHAHLTTLPPPMKESNPRASVPPGVERVVMRCLEKDPAKRPQSARDLADEFLRAAGLSPGQTATLSTSSGSDGRKNVGVGLAAAAALFLLVGLVWAVVSSRRGSPPPPADADLARANDTHIEKRVAPWIPDGYEPVSDERVTGSRDEVVKLKRLADGVVFVRSERPGVYVPDGYNPEFSDSRSSVVTRLERIAGGAKFDRTSWGVYLPAGYEEVPGDRIVSWPSAIKRSKDGVKFIRITGGTYQRGDPGVDPAQDSEGQPCSPHSVRVPDYYIQETEVTNAEIAAYIKADPDREKDLKFWQGLYSDLCGGNTKEEIARAGRFPATLIDYRTARKYAASVQGLLPTEAEWEYAARSRGQANPFSWGPDPTPKNAPLKANLDSPALDFGKQQDDKPKSVDDFPEDATGQHVLGMTGGVLEFCADVYKPYGELDLTRFSPRNPLVDRRDHALPKGDEFKVVVKGGSFLLKQSESKAYLRKAVLASERTGYIGFRVVIECPPEDWPHK
jgi:eukaryotic-like serine/threonine-protein kinase